MTDQGNTAIPHPSLACGYKAKRRFKSEVDRIENSIQIIARLIVLEGEIYLPIFQRLEKELKMKEQNARSLQNALALASKDKIL